MKKIIVAISLWIPLLNVSSQVSPFQVFTNPVIPGDHPDCTLTRVGNDFYTTGSSFNPTPVIYHSTDLVHWEAISQPVSASWTGYGDSPGGGCWGGQVVFYGGKYWDFFSRANTMYYVKADNPRGPWSDPVRISNPSTLPYGLGYDNSVFVDDNNKWYLVVKNGQPNNGIVELSGTGQPTGVVYDLKWLNPGPSYPFSWAEGPVMWKYNGYYYYSFARDVAGGQKVMRSKILTAEQGAWEMPGDFFNENDPQKAGSLFTGPNHSSAPVMPGDSTSWVLHPLYAKGEWKGQGRQGLLNQVRYDAKGWPVADYPVNRSFTAPALPGSGIPWMVPKSDYFNTSGLNPEWSFLGYTSATTWSLTERPGWIRMSPKSTTKANTILKNDGEHNYSLVTRLHFNPKSNADEAGLRILRGDESKFVKLSASCNADGKKIIFFSFENIKQEAPNPGSDTLWLKMVRINHKISGYFSTNGASWTQIGQETDISSIDSYSDFASWAGTRQGLYVQGGEKAWFDLYIYRDAFTPILAECPANQSGTVRGEVSGGIAVLGSIHPNDWVMYAGTEFGNGAYDGKADSVEFTAASATNGGILSVWLDSAGTGTKIAECKINNTGGWGNYRKFTAPVQAVTGNHDVYLTFSGNGPNELFRLKWIVFSRKQGTVNAHSLSFPAGKISVFPNPARNVISIRSGFAFHTAEIYNIRGQRILLKQTNCTENSILPLNLLSGFYQLKISGDHYSAVSKLIVNL